MTEDKVVSRLLEEGVHVRGLDEFRGRVEMEVIPPALPGTLGDYVIVRMPNLGVNDRVGQVVRYSRPLHGPDRITVELEPRPT